jgi:hypothetical protein
MKPNQVKKNLIKKSELFEKDINKIAEQVRLEIIKPFCDKYNLDFVSGMGIWNFTVNDYLYDYGSFDSVEDIPYDWSTDENELERYKFDGVEEILELLNTEIPSNFRHWGGGFATFGLYLNDYRSVK